MHLTELTLAIQSAGPAGCSTPMSTRFKPLSLPERTRKAGPDYARLARPASLLDKVMLLIGR